MPADVVAVLDGVIGDEVLDSGDIARALGTSVRSVTRWQLKEATPRRESAERLLELKAVSDLLRRYLRPESAQLWIRSPNPDLGYQKPIDLLARGDYLRVIAAILAMAEGVTS